MSPVADDLMQGHGMTSPGRPTRDLLLLEDIALPLDRAVDTDELRLEIGRHDYPRILLWGAALLAGFSILNWLTDSAGSATSHLIDALVVIMAMLAAFVISRPWLPLRATPWLFAGVASLAVVGLMLSVILEGSLVSYVYGIIAMCLVGPATLGWRPFLAEGAVTMIMAAIVASNWMDLRSLDWIIVALAALAVSALLLRLRLRSIYALGDALAVARALASTDQLTGVLNRHGLLDRTPALWSLAERLDSPVFAAFVDIDGLKRANDLHGHEHGDRMIQAAASAVTGSVRTEDLVARWGGDEFVVLGLGSDHDATEFLQRLNARPPQFADSGQLSVGLAVGPERKCDVDDLIRRADEDMYRRRMDRRDPHELSPTDAPR